MTAEKKDVLQPVDDSARRLSKTLIRTARQAALGTIDPTDGSPFVSRVSLATAMDGSPVFLISRLSGHFANLESDPRCSLLVGEPGKGDPLAHPRITFLKAKDPVTGKAGYRFVGVFELETQDAGIRTYHRTETRFALIRRAGRA